MLLHGFTESDTHEQKIGQLQSRWEEGIRELTSFIHEAISEFNVLCGGSGNRALQ